MNAIKDFFLLFICAVYRNFTNKYLNNTSTEDQVSSKLNNYFVVKTTEIYKIQIIQKNIYILLIYIDWLQNY